CNRTMLATCYDHCHLCTPRALFFFQSDGGRRDLHSFPTRRSSDLLVDARPRAEHQPPGDHHQRGDVVEADVGELRGAVQVEEGRSEEHTSELQSQSNLVCRLLLEKKKKTTLEEPIGRTISGETGSS